MTYVPTIWVDEVTEVDAANLNKMERGIEAATVVFNVRHPDFAGGAKGDDVADDTDAIAAAVAAAKAVGTTGLGAAGSAVVLLPPGTYRVSGAGAAPIFDLSAANKIQVIGAGMEAAVIKRTAGTGPVFSVTGDVPSPDGYMRFSGFTVNGNSTGGRGFDCTYAAPLVRWESVYVINCTDGWFLSSCYEASFDNCYAEYNSGWGFNLHTANDATPLTKCFAANNGVGDDTTGTITAGTASLVVADATGMAIGDFITVQGAGVAGAGGTGDLVTTISNIAGTTITLAANAGTSKTDTFVRFGRGGGFRFSNSWSGPAVGLWGVANTVGILVETVGSGELQAPMIVGCEFEGSGRSLAGLLTRKATNPVRGLRVFGGFFKAGGLGMYLGGLTDAYIAGPKTKCYSGVAGEDASHIQVAADSSNVEVVGHMYELDATESPFIDMGANTGGKSLRRHRLFFDNDDAQPQFHMSTDSGGQPRISMGPGGSTAVDNYIERTAPNVLHLGGGWQADHDIYARLGTASQVGIGDAGGSPQVTLGNATPAKYLRSAADTGQVPHKLHVTGELELDGALNHDGTTVGFYGTAPVAKQTGVAVTVAAVHAALVNLGLIAP